MSSPQKILKKIGKWLGIILLGILGLLIIVVLLIRTEWAQNKIVNYATDFVSDKTGTVVEIDRLFLTFRGNVQLEGVYLEDLEKDTLLYFNTLEAGVGVRSLFGDKIKISRVDLDGLRANVFQSADSVFNFQFLIDAFAPADTAAAAPPADTSTSPPPTIELGPVHFTDFKINYLDSLGGMDAQIRLGNLQLSTDNLDLEKMRFELEDIFLENTSAKVVQFFPPPPSPDTAEAPPLPFLSFDGIALRNVSAEYLSSPDDLEARMTIGDFSIGSSELDLPQQIIDIETVKLLDSDIYLKMAAAQTDKTVEKADSTIDGNVQEVAESPVPFEWPKWRVAVGQILLQNNDIAFHQNSETPQPDVFDANHIVVNNLVFDVQDISLEENQASLELADFSFAERSGFRLEQLAFNSNVNNEDFNLENLRLKTGNSLLNAQISVGYPDIQKLMDDPQSNAKFGILFGETSLSVKDAFYFNDSLRYDTLVQKIAPFPIEIAGGISGSTDKISIKNLKIDALNSTRFVADGGIENPLDSLKLKVNFPQLDLKTVAADLGIVLDRKNPQESLPKYVSLKTDIRGNAQKLNAKVDVNTPNGSATLRAAAENIMTNPAYRGKLELDKFEVGKFAQNPELQPVSLTLDFDGAGKSLEEIRLDAQLAFQQLIFRDYNYAGLALDAKIQDQKADVQMDFADENLEFVLTLNALLDTANTVADLTLDLEGADLKDLHFQANPMKVATLLNAHFEGNADDFKTQLTLKKNLLLQRDDAYRLDSIFIGLQNRLDTVDLRIHSEVINGKMTANTSLQTLLASLQSYQKKMMSGDTSTTDTTYKNLDMKADFKVANSPLFTQIFLPQLTRLDTVRLDMAFRPSEEILRVDLDAPNIVYGGTTVDSLYLDIDATRSRTDAHLGFGNIASGPVDIYHTELDLVLESGDGTAQLSIEDAGDSLVFFTSASISESGGTRIIKIDDKKLILNSNPWEILPSNEIRLESELTRFQDFVLSRNSQKFSIENVTEGQNEKMKLDFSNFNLAAIFSILNAEETPVGGTLGGNVTFNDLTGTPAFVADVTLENLTAVGAELGTLKLQANNQTADKYVVDLSLSGGGIDLTADGNYSTAGTAQNVDLKLDISKIEMKILEEFAPDQLAETSGFLTGNFTVNGSTDDPQFEGNLGFKDVKFRSLFVGAPYTLGDEKIKVNNEGIYFENFTIRDSINNKMSLDGEVGIAEMTNPTFDLQLKADEFLALSSTAEDNDLVYGKAVVSLDVSVTGNANLPVVNADVKLGEGTEISYVVPATQAQVQERAGIVRFVNMQDSADVLSEEETSTQTVTGLDVTAYINITPGTTFNVIIDQQSGDQLKLTGEANLNYTLNPNGNMNLSGAYELSDGFYQLSLYELVKKKFDISPGSRIIWSGDPMTAELELTAIYNVETAPAELMAYQLSGQSANSAGRYNQKLPFRVLLNIDGTIDKPEISFGLEMPDDSKDAIGGSVYRRIQQLNEDESELNKQVFSLIVFNRFLPAGAGSDAGGGGEQLARSSVSKLLSGQLNKLSEKYIQGIELNFDLDSYQDFQTGQAQQRTDLNVSLKKSLFGDRVVVQVGSSVGIEGEPQENSAIIGDISVEYLLTEEGTYRLKAFRENQYQDLVQGQVTITGLGLLFNKEFDTWGDLWKPEEEKEKNSE